MTRWKEQEEEEEKEEEEEDTRWDYPQMIPQLILSVIKEVLLLKEWMGRPGIQKKIYWENFLETEISSRDLTAAKKKCA